MQVGETAGEAVTLNRITASVLVRAKCFHQYFFVEVIK